ncbi:MAG: TIGR01777 family oxidoreductase [Planctomycetota bacterium]
MLPVDAETAFAYHERPGALSRLIPPWQHVQVQSSDRSLEAGSKVTLRLSLGPLRLHWHAEHTKYDPPHSFEDIQASGPFAAWKHRHLFVSESGPDRTELRDEISYELPLGSFGALLGSGKVKKDLEQMFAYRHQVTRDDLQLAKDYDLKPLKIAVSGSSGLLGKRLVDFLSLLGHQVVSLQRKPVPEGADAASIAPWSSEDEARRLEGLDVVIHLAGKSIASGRWNPRVKEEIRSSRVELTTELSDKLARLDDPPEVFICASATGIYGDRHNEELDETSEVGRDFLAGVATEWEASCRSAKEAGIRVVHARFGIILDPKGGALAKMLLPAKLFGGALGNGRQWWAWVSIDDAVGAIYHAIANQSVSGPMNVVSPEPVTNREFANRLAKVIGRVALFPAPALGLRTALGEMADALLLASTRAYPRVLEQSGYQFRFMDVESALKYCLGKNRLESIE